MGELAQVLQGVVVGSDGATKDPRIGEIQSNLMILGVNHTKVGSQQAVHTHVVANIAKEGVANVLKTSGHDQISL
jgi:hypothetical protein